ncbi:hypothetical protein Bca4012_011287 [Brassica carinata]|uniref:Transcription repressor n=1 Tax=Brassica carinata TaxID=52824 RepID=A0A8X7V1C1_BRACI|nr:hypothetical protein Bca52824_036172 [Brassica carinata]
MKEMNQKMGTHKFRFSDMMPHSWLYKLKGISRSSSRKHLPSSPKHLSSSSSIDASSSRNTLRLSSSPYHPQGSSSPPKSPFKRKLKRKTVYKPSSRLKLSSSSPNPLVPVTTSRNHRSKPTSANAIILEPSSLNPHVPLTTSRKHRYKPNSANAIIVEPSLTSSRDHRSKPSSANAVSDSSDHVSSSPSEQDYGFSGDLASHSVDVKDNNSVKKLDDVSEDPSNSSHILVETVKKPPLEIKTQKKLKKPKSGSTGIRIRANSPRIARKKTKGRTSPQPMKKEMAESFAIVLTSVDPERDFRESMVEMIVENKMKEQKDLEDLLACYLSLNSSEYHDTIIKAFEKTWFHLTHLN